MPFAAQLLIFKPPMCKSLILEMQAMPIYITIFFWRKNSYDQKYSVGHWLLLNLNNIKSTSRSSRRGSVVNKFDQEPWGCGFDPWPCSVGWGSDIAVSCGVGCRCGSDPMLLWLWSRSAAIAPIGLLAWEPPCTAEAALEMAKRQEKYKKI